MDGQTTGASKDGWADGCLSIFLSDNRLLIWRKPLQPDWRGSAERLPADPGIGPRGPHRFIWMRQLIHPLASSPRVSMTKSSTRDLRSRVQSAQGRATPVAAVEGAAGSRLLK